ncbi:MAG: hypothetical protein L7F78_10890 [Syntrophales bacterium LBB04]|nr:hypothetical protein [Syntrophales bacterium LBB04]
MILHLEELMLWRRTFLFDVDNTLLATAVTSPLALVYSRQLASSIKSPVLFFDPGKKRGNLLLVHPVPELVIASVLQTNKGMRKMKRPGPVHSPVVTPA